MINNVQLTPAETPRPTGGSVCPSVPGRGVDPADPIAGPTCGRRACPEPFDLWRNSAASLKINSAEGLEGEMSVPELVLSPVEGLPALAMQAEQESERFYADLARRSQGESARAMFQHLSRMEGSHFHLLQVEHDLVTQFPDYYNVEEFHFGDELIHLGP